MAKYRKRPIVIEAHRWDGDWDKLREWLHSSAMAKHPKIDDDYIVKSRLKPDHLQIQTLEGQLYARPGDWIICGVVGELYPCRSDIFHETYEAVEGHIMPDGMDAGVPCRPAFDVDTPSTIRGMIETGLGREYVITAIMNNDQMCRADAEGRYETELANIEAAKG